MQRFLLNRATLVTLDSTQQVVQDGWLGFSEAGIDYVGKDRPSQEQWLDAELIDGSDLIALPGLTNLHAHAGMTTMRGSGDDMPLMQWLNERIWPMEAKLTAEDVYWGTKLGLLEMVRGGTTAVNDMYFHNDQVARACSDIGLRANISCALFGIRDDADRWLARAVETVSTNAGSDLLSYNFGPHALYTCPPEYLERVACEADRLGVGIQTHLCETRQEIEECKANYGGRTPVEVMRDAGVFRRPTVAAHCVHLTDSDVEILAAHDVTAVHNPCSNMKLASGIADTTRLAAAGVNVTLGTDSAVSNNNLSMLGEMRTAALLQKVASEDPTKAPAGEIVTMATRNGAKALGLEGKIGVLAPGYLADITLIRSDGLDNLPGREPLSSLAYSLTASDVDSVFVAGVPLLRGGEFVSIDVDETVAHCREIADRISN